MSSIDLIKEIDASFTIKGIPSEVMESNCADDDIRKVFLNNDWKSIGDWSVANYNYDALYFFTKEAQSYYLPFFMTQCINELSESSQILDVIDSTLWSGNLLSTLNKRQIEILLYFYTFHKFHWGLERDYLDKLIKLETMSAS